MEQHLTSNGILTAWEAGVGRRPLDRALAILWAAGIPGDLAALPLAERDRALLRIRAGTFGPKLSARASCHKCAEELEMEFEALALAKTLPDCMEETLQIGGRDIVFRALTSKDLAAATLAPEEDAPAVLRTRLTGGEELPKGLHAEIDTHIEAREADAELTARLTCSACKATWKEVLDIPALLWAEIEAAALRLLGEIAEIAGALGWSERDIIALSEPRRQAYLSLARRA